MKDAGIEAKRDAERDRPTFMMANYLAASLGNYEGAVRATLADVLVGLQKL